MRSKNSHDPSIQKSLDFSFFCLLHFSLPIITTETIASFQHFIMHLFLFPQHQACILLVLVCSLLPLQLNLKQYKPVAIFWTNPIPKGTVQTSHGEAGCIDNTHPGMGADEIFILTRL